jgi:hypothetical protein
VRQQAARLASIRKYIDHVAATYRGPRLHILNGWSIAALIDVKPTADGDEGDESNGSRRLDRLEGSRHRQRA